MFGPSVGELLAYHNGPADDDEVEVYFMGLYGGDMPGLWERYARRLLQPDDQWRETGTK